MAHNESVVVARRASQRAELDGETVSSRLLATVTVPARRVAVTAALQALRRRWRRLANHITTQRSVARQAQERPNKDEMKVV